MSKKKPVIKDSAFFARIGRMGGNTTKRRQLNNDPDYYSKIGMIGGQIMKETRGREFYSKIGKMSKGSKAEIKDDQEV